MSAEKEVTPPTWAGLFGAAPGIDLTGEKDGPMAEAAAWIADSIGYPVEVKMPDHPMPQGLWDALVDHVHADESGKWHGNTLDREDVELWLADEAGRAVSFDEGGDQ